jgi:phospholipid/cholesterol/gamma-HCH transport system substrate-binding protein
LTPTARSSKGSRARRRGIHPLVIAAVAIFATVFVTYYAFNQGLPFVHRYTLYAVVNNSVNLRPDSPVRIAGIDVGTVEGVAPFGRATKVAFTVDSSGLPIHKDATIRVRDRLFLEGGYYLELDPGSPSAPALHDGDAIPMSQTSTPVQFYNVLSTFDSATRASLANVLNTLNEGFSAQPGHPLSDSGAGGLKAATGQLTPVLKDTALITRALRGTQPGDLETLLSSASQVTSTLAGSSSQLADLVTGLNRTSRALAASDGALGQSISGLDQTLQVAPAALAAIDHSLPPLVNLATTLDPALKVAPPILDAVTGAVKELAAVVAPAARAGLLTSLKATFQQFPSILHQLAIVFPVTKQLSDCLRTHVLPVFKAQVPDGSLSTGEPVWQDFLHFLPGVAGASGTFDANGPWTRTLLGAGTNSVSGGVLGTIPLLGQLVGAGPSGNTSLLGARPAWVGDLKPSDFRPSAPCSSQPVPSLAALAAAADLHATGSRPPSARTVTRAKAELAQLSNGLVGK